MADVIDELADLTTLRVERDAQGVVLATLDRPDRANAQTMAMFAELESVAAAVDADPDVRVLVLTGAGRAFCAGYDLGDAAGLGDLGALGMLTRQEHAARAMAVVRGVRVPVIAAVNGAAAGGGFALALAADIRLASPTARFNVAMVRIGLSGGDLGISWLLPRVVGPAVAAEMAFTGRLVDAEEAARTGLVNRVVEDVVGEAMALAAQICANSPGGVQLSKRALQANLEVSSYEAARELENRGQALLTRSDDMPEALAAFREKRPARFVGR